ncbi:tryptophan halogenase family protein [Sphingomonas sp.]|uniref:tryptophan halogenase family protein n=1 Tax=Sphingomonas sp. TaxID=28214 RepID=UPI003B3BAEE2
MADPIRNIVIVGGGTAGWMAAAMMARLLGGGRVSIQLIESDAIGTIGVGEATIPAIRDFNALLGIDERDFLRATQGSFKMGIEFVNWLRVGHHYLHPFGTHGRDTQNVRFHQLWLKLIHDGLATSEDDLAAYSISALAAGRGRFSLPESNGNHPLSTLNYAFHFDAALYARYLRGWSERQGVIRHEGTVQSVGRDGEKGLVRSVTLADGSAIEGDLFIDCSGFRALLLGEALAEPFEDWSAWLPCDRAIAIPSAVLDPLPPFTRAIADAAGWRWRIPLQHRTGNGYVYSSAHIDDDAAQARLIATLETPACGEPRRLSFRAGRRRRAWCQNVVAIGLSAGFLEPLESTSIHLVHTGIARLMTFFPDMQFAAPDRDAFNQQTAREYEAIRDFLILHYKATERTDTPFWQQCRTMAVPDTLARKIDLFRSKGRILRDADDLFSQDSWLAVLIGQAIMPAGHDPLADAIPVDALRQQMTALRAALARAVEPLPAHSDFLAHYTNGSPIHV